MVNINERHNHIRVPIREKKKKKKRRRLLIKGCKQYEI